MPILSMISTALSVTSYLIREETKETTNETEKNIIQENKDLEKDPENER